MSCLSWANGDSRKFRSTFHSTDLVSPRLLFFWLEITIFAANGPFAIAVFIVQILCGIYQRFLLSVTILQTILCALALFTLSSSITNVYFIVSFFCRVTTSKSILACSNRKRRLPKLHPRSTYNSYCGACAGCNCR